MLRASSMNRRLSVWKIVSIVLLGYCSTPAMALDWSNNSISWRYGSNFREPFNNQAISKHIVSLTHASGYRYGSNYLNIDLLKSDNKDPIRANSNTGAEEIYLVYRHTLDIGSVSGQDLKFGPVRGVGISAGIDLNSKSDAGYNSRKQMFALGPTVMMDVPGFLNFSLLALWESNNPGVSAGAFNPGYPAWRYRYATHAMLNAVWSIPVGSLPLSFEGFANLIAPKGRDETGSQTATETNIDMQLMYDLSAATGVADKTFRAGIEYQYWHNKFGNSSNKVGALGGNTASTPMIRFEYIF